LTRTNIQTKTLQKKVSHASTCGTKQLFKHAAMVVVMARNGAKSVWISI